MTSFERAQVVTPRTSEGPKSKYNLQMFDLKLIVECFLRYLPNKSAFDDKLKVSCPAGVDNYLICMHCF